MFKVIENKRHLTKYERLRFKNQVFFFQIRIKAIHLDRRIVVLSCPVILKESTHTFLFHLNFNK